MSAGRAFAISPPNRFDFRSYNCQQNPLCADWVAICNDKEMRLFGSELAGLEVINTPGSQPEPQFERQRFIRHALAPQLLKRCQFVDSAGHGFASFGVEFVTWINASRRVF